MTIRLNDEQSRMNETEVASVTRPACTEAVQRHVRAAARAGRVVSVAGGRHAMGGQQFARDAAHLDMTGLTGVRDLDVERGLATVAAGTMWPELIETLERLQPGDRRPWTIRQKQTGVDEVTVGGSVAANVHGRGLAMRPFSDDIESLVLVTADGEARECSRRENAELFSLAVGGYGLFGVVTEVTLRLMRRVKLRRRVACVPVAEAVDRLTAARDGDALFGDCQYSPDLSGDAETHDGVLPVYEPVAGDVPLTPTPKALSPEEWAGLYRLIRTDKPRAYAVYADHYLKTDGQVYLSDRHQLAGAFAGHKRAVDAARGTEMITEAYVDAAAFADFMADARAVLRASGGDISYGTIRLIEADEVSFLRWADRPLVCVVCNLHTPNTAAGRGRVARQFRSVIDSALRHGGRFYLTYHRWATPGQVAAAYPMAGEFFRLKRHHDQRGVFRSAWFRHYAAALA